MEKVEYRPTSVYESLLEMKDISELMIDLAYSSVLLNSRELAEEVLELEKRMDTMVYVLNMNLMLAARDREDAETLVGVAKIGSLTNNISDAAADIAGIVLHGLSIHPIVREAFERVEEHIARVEVSEGSEMVDKNLDELELAARFGVNVIAIRRGRHWLLNPGKEVVMPGDILVARGTSEGLEELRELAEGERGLE
ncbi:MAG: potassium channel protein [Candidatus Bathyarchaeota archaeon B23]|nr:MAG: potassium channel protein [Candidatus Bathyarchaeota archaeon B23]